MNELVKIDVSYEYAPKVYAYKRDSGWFWKYELPNGNWFYGKAPGNDKKSVTRNARKKELELAKGIFTQKELSRMQEGLTFLVAIDEYLENLKAEDASPNYYRSMDTQLKSIARYFSENHRITFVHKLTESKAYDFRKDLLLRVQADEISRPTAFRALNDVKRLFKWLRKRKKIQVNPWVEVEAISVPKEQRVRTLAPTKDIVNKLMSANYVHRYEFPIKEFVYGLFRTGARKEELLYLEVGDVDWETGVWVIKPKSCPIKHGRKWAPKYRKARVTVIPQDLLEMLRPLVKRAQSHTVVGYSPNKDNEVEPVEAKFVFSMLDRRLSDLNEKVYRRVDSIRAAWGALFSAAGLMESKRYSSEKTKKYKNGEKLRTDVGVPFTRHDMRRAFNLEAKMAGMSLDDRALILGHSKEVNEAHYRGRHEFDADKIAEFVNSKMSGKSRRLKIVS